MEETAIDYVAENENVSHSSMEKSGKSTSCLNCGMPLKMENFCPNCGQKNDARKLSAWEIITEGLSSFFSVDSKAFRSLRPMLTRPGQIVLNYNAGKRSSYVHPARMYLSVSIIYFLITSIISGPKEDVVKMGNNNIDSDAKRGNMVVFFEPDSLSDNDFKRIAYFIRNHSQLSWEEVVEISGITPSIWKRYYFAQSKKLVNLDWKSFKGYILSKIPIILFLILPILALYLKLFYLRRGIYYADHLTFAYYTQSALFILLTIGALISLIVGSDFELIIAGILFLYLYFSFRRVYRQKRLITLIKLSAISFLYIVSGFVFMLLAGVFLFLWY